MYKKRPGLFVLVLVTLMTMHMGCTSNAAKETEGVQDPFSVRMANAEMQRFPELWQSDHTDIPRWGYHQGLMGKVMLDMWKHTGNDAYYQYAKTYADTMITADGTIKTYNVSSYNIDLINAGKMLFTLYEETGETKYKLAMDTLVGQLKYHPRTSEGGFWHKKRYPHQMWLDGLYMGSPFLAQYARVFDKPELFDVAVKQVELLATHTYDPETSLFYHGWDESREQRWADKETGLSSNFWGRSVGWFAMALVDIMDYLPQDHKGREIVLDAMRKVAKGIKKYQDEDSGVWYQVLDQGDREGNYLESSASSMFVYFLYKAVREGYIDKAYLQTAEKGYQGLVETFIKEKENSLSITNCCVVAGLGGSPRYRDGSFEYYISEPVRDNDPKAVAPFIWASIEHEKAHNIQM